VKKKISRNDNYIKLYINVEKDLTLISINKIL